MSYQMGLNGLLNFKKMISALSAHDYLKASEEALDSGYAKTTPNRAQRNAEILRTGEI